MKRDFIMESRPKSFEVKWSRTHRPAGGLFLGLRLVYPIQVCHNNPKFKLVAGVFIPQPTTFSVWHLDVGLVLWTVSFYFRKPVVS